MTRPTRNNDSAITVPDILHRSEQLALRGTPDTEKRQATFCCATERPIRVSRYAPPEVLRMSGVKLERFNASPVFLDSHNRWGMSDVLGSAEVQVDGRELVAVVTYASTPEGERAWTLVREGHIRTVSIGYAPRVVRPLEAGETDGEGEAEVRGPASIVEEWELYEVSQVPIPADTAAARRSYYESRRQEGAMQDKSNTTSEATKPEGERAADPKTETNTAPLADEVNARRERAKQELAEAKASQRCATAKGLRAICPEGLRGYLDTLLLEHPDISDEEARKLLLQEQAERSKPVGTPEPPEPKTTEQTDGERGDKPAISAADVVKAFSR